MLVGGPQPLFPNFDWEGLLEIDALSHACNKFRAILLTCCLYGLMRFVRSSNKVEVKQGVDRLHAFKEARGVAFG